ncbi:MAG: hypothetical protein HY819_17835 [Acidobacteria bacterium]|nr:hypothetical protein [Acidobacteriota bacterium]
MSSKLFYGMFAFTLAFLLGLIAYWAVNKQYVSKHSFHQTCPKSINQNTSNGHNNHNNYNNHNK